MNKLNLNHCYFKMVKLKSVRSGCPKQIRRGKFLGRPQTGPSLCCDREHYYTTISFTDILSDLSKYYSILATLNILSILFEEYKSNPLLILYAS